MYYKERARKLYEEYNSTRIMDRIWSPIDRKHADLLHRIAEFDLIFKKVEYKYNLDKKLEIPEQIKDNQISDGEEEKVDVARDYVMANFLVKEG